MLFWNGKCCAFELCAIESYLPTSFSPKMKIRTCRYGPGPYKVLMIVELDENQHEVMIELASPKLMPHSVHTFLSQISEGYWTRGTPAFVMNPGHVLQACPHPCLETKALGGSYPGDPYVDMKHAGLDAVSFQEYHPDYPHEKYTIGFAGRPHSGPEFYINIMNNTLDHGPIEARKRALGDDYNKDGDDEVDETTLEPDPCFGKIVSGFDVIDKISEGLTRADLPDESKERGGDVDEVLSDSLLIQPVKIVSMSIIVESDGVSSEDMQDEL
jgi:cyclophilin family peptidyl-prolyl cis-trans isomerase